MEPYSEYYAAQVAEYFHVPYVKYELRSRNGRVHSACDIFTSEKYGYLPYAAIGDVQSDVFSNSGVMQIFADCKNVSASLGP